MTTKEKLKKIWQFINRNFIGLPEKSSNNQESLNAKTSEPSLITFFNELEFKKMLKKEYLDISASYLEGFVSDNKFIFADCSSILNIDYGKIKSVSCGIAVIQDKDNPKIYYLVNIYTNKIIKDLYNVKFIFQEYGYTLFSSEVLYEKTYEWLNPLGQVEDYFEFHSSCDYCVAELFNIEGKNYIRLNINGFTVTKKKPVVYVNEFLKKEDESKKDDFVDLETLNKMMKHYNISDEVQEEISDYYLSDSRNKIYVYYNESFLYIEIKCRIFNNTLNVIVDKNGKVLMNKNNVPGKYLDMINFNDKTLYLPSQTSQTGNATYFDANGDIIMEISNQKIPTSVIASRKEILLRANEEEKLLNESTIKSIERDNAREELAKKKALLQEINAKIAQNLDEYNDLIANIRKLGIYHSLSFPSDFFINRNDVKMINPIYVADLKYYDLLMVDFEGCLVSGIDFSDTNARINPQEVYNKYMSNGNYSGVIILNYNMTGVNIENAIFTNDFINAYQEDMVKLKSAKTRRKRLLRMPKINKM